MTAELFTPEQIEAMTSQINAELHALTAAEPAMFKGAKTARARTPRQCAAIEQATGQDATTFLARFHAAARQDLCEEGGILHAQWQKYHDLATKDMIKTFGPILVALGVSAGTLPTVLVAIATHVLYLGVTAFCAGADQA